MSDKPIPERYRKSYEDGPGWVQPVYEELGAAEARIRELEQALQWILIPAESDLLPDGKDKWCRFCGWMIHVGHYAGCRLPAYENLLAALHVSDKAAKP